MSDLTLNETLSARGYTTKPAGFYKKHILRDSEIVFTGDSLAVWDWLGIDIDNPESLVLPCNTDLSEPTHGEKL